MRNSVAGHLSEAQNTIHTAALICLSQSNFNVCSCKRSHLTVDVWGHCWKCSWSLFISQHSDFNTVNWQTTETDFLIHSPEKNTHAFHIHSFIKCIDRVCFYHLLKQLSSSKRSFLHPASFRMTKNMTRKTSLTVWSNLICESHWSSTSSRPPKRLQNRAEISMKQFLHPRYILITIFDISVKRNWLMARQVMLSKPWPGQTAARPKWVENILQSYQGVSGALTRIMFYDIVSQSIWVGHQIFRLYIVRWENEECWGVGVGGG